MSETETLPRPIVTSQPVPTIGQNAPAPSFPTALAAWCAILLLISLAIFEMKAPDALPATSPANEFSAERALAHVRAIAGAPRPLGSSANTAAREYIVAQLSALGMTPQVSTALGIHDGSGPLIVAKTNDVIGRVAGTANSGAVILMAHYDSVNSGPGAADDAAGVAAILETVRALRTEPRLKNDLIVLLTDGEEEGLLGAEAFVAAHPVMKDVGLLMNFEARGNEGPSLLFETSANNAALINEVAHSAPYPVGSSLFYSLYKLLPNDTDFTVFRPTHTPGLNFAFGNRLEAYHSSLDTANNLDLRSLQHHGSYALALTRHFGQVDLSRLKEQTTDDVFFDWVGSNMIAYSVRWVLVGEVVVTLLLFLTIVLGVQRLGVRLRKLFPAVLFSLLVLVIIPVLMEAAGWLTLRLVGSRMIQGDNLANTLLMIGLTALATSLGCLFVVKSRTRFHNEELTLAGLLVVCVLSWVFALLLPTGSYLLFWPLLFATSCFFIIAALRIRSAYGQILATSPSAVVTILLFSPVAYLLYIFLTLNLISIAAVGLLLGLFFIICMPLIIGAAAGQKIVLPLLTGAAVSLGVGILLSHASAQHPRHDTLLYSLNADHHTAAWLSFDRELDGYTSQFFAGKTAVKRPAPDYLTGSQALVLSQSAAAIDLKPPISEIEVDKRIGDVHELKMTVKSQRDANLLVVRFDPSIKPIALKVCGRNLTARPGTGGLRFLLYGMGNQGADLELTVNAPHGVTFWITDYSNGLSTTRHRPAEFVAAQGSDQTLVSEKYKLN